MSGIGGGIPAALADPENVPVESDYPHLNSAGQDRLGVSARFEPGLFGCGTGVGRVLVSGASASWSDVNGAVFFHGLFDGFDHLLGDDCITERGTGLPAVEADVREVIDLVGDRALVGGVGA